MGTMLEELSASTADLAERAGRSLVRVDGRRRMSASGVVWSADGLIVTAHHVVEREEGLEVGLPDGSTVAATLVGRDPSTDVALLRVAATGLTPAEWVDAADLRVGNLVLALGRPGKSVQATLGVVSALGGAWRTGGGGEVDRYLQTDVVMYPGFSGGALAVAGGRAAGMNTSGLMRGVSLALPAGTLKRVVEALHAHGNVPRGFMGVGVQPVRLAEELAQTARQETGLMVMSVEAGGPAAQAGLVQGDVMLAVDGAAMRHLDDLQVLLMSGSAGKSVPVRYVRGGVVQESTITIGQK